MSNKEFLAFVRRPRYLADEDGILLYEDTKEDNGGKTNFALNLCRLIPFVAFMIFLAYYYAESLPEFLINMVVYFWGTGICFVWTLTEYYFHRFRLHRELNLDPNGVADGKKNAEIFSTHVHHHVFMNQKHRVTLDMRIYY